MKRKVPDLDALDGRKSKIQKLSFETVEIKQEKSSDEESSTDDDSSSDDENEVKMELDEPKELLNIKILHNDEKRRSNIITTPFLTKFEIAKVIGIRAQHIAMGSPVAVETHGETNPIEIAKMELKVCGPSAWNALPNSLRDGQFSRANFLSRLKTFLFRD